LNVAIYKYLIDNNNVQTYLLFVMKDFCCLSDSFDTSTLAYVWTPLCVLGIRQHCVCQ